MNELAQEVSDRKQEIKNFLIPKEEERELHREEQEEVKVEEHFEDRGEENLEFALLRLDPSFK